ncbi:uracil phosphoribosyltransferase [Euzebya sp.]|uniref:uracil phosphoribosyltransferase n=1 Tax=Euzebya sp. TaxID=1971409 RepID=UPI003512CFC8
MATISTLRSAAVRHYLDQLKDTGRGRATFRDALGNITTLLVAHALAELGDPDDVVFVPIIRGGLGMVEGALAASPGAAVGHVGIYRDRTSRDVIEYYSRVPAAEGQVAIVLDPMMASGGTMLAAVEAVESAGYSAVAVATVVAARQGCDLLAEEAPALTHLFTCEIDDHPPEVGALRNGLGDAGARLYGTA